MRYPILAALLGVAILPSSGASAPRSIDADVCVYTATPSGILAAIAVKREGRSVVIVEPSRWLGGMLGAGLKPTQDCPNIKATGGLTRPLLLSLGQLGWRPGSDETAKRQANRAISPMDIREDFLELLAEHGIEVIHEHRVAQCRKDGHTIAEAVFDLAPFDELGCPVAQPAASANLTVKAGVFIDASYEGDLTAAAGVGFRVGRESAEEFDEENAGVREPMDLTPVDPFVEPGNPKSGLLKWVENDHGKPIGAADRYTQAYNYRYYTTADPAHRIPLTPPADYSARDFELVGRYVEHLKTEAGTEGQLHERLTCIFPGWMNSGEWNYQRRSLITMAPVGISHLYAAGDYAAKARVWKAHQDYLRGLHHFISTDHRVPAAFREKTAALGLDGRHHPDTQGWPHQLYIRVSRRLRGRYTITAHDVYNRTTVTDPIGLAQYGIDTYPARRIWLEQEGRTFVATEGKMFIGGAKGPTNVPYPIPYRAITPPENECGNLLVSVCFSASHLGYASARMEPVFMICGESAGIAACQALDEKTTVQKIDPKAFQRKLIAAGQMLDWDGGRADNNVDLLKQSGSHAGTSNAELNFALLLRECDTDGDSLVTQAEWNAGKQDWAWLFSVIDTDENGKLDEAEYMAFQEYKKKNPKWAEKRPGKG